MLYRWKGLYRIETLISEIARDVKRGAVINRWPCEELRSVGI